MGLRLGIDGSPYDRGLALSGSAYVSLLYAEAQNITMATANSFPKTCLFVDAYENMFQHAVAAVGNYGEMYSRHLAPIA